MSVLIKGMGMPEECLRCFMCDKNFNNLEGETINDWMCLLYLRFVPKGGRPEWCPLVEVPSPQVFAEEMKEIRDRSNGDYEIDHRCADGVMLNTLATLGYEEGVKIFDDEINKWYA